MKKITVTRYHDFCAGHRVVGHENKCKHFHGHNYRIHFTVSSIDGLDDIGRVMDFSVIKTLLCEWLEINWDHKFLMYRNDPFLNQMLEMDSSSVVVVQFNPTAENMARHLVEVVAPNILKGLNCELVECRIDETRKCSSSYVKS
jgi:6-pyruvoyltetrahydropterin/6-carboxytetrahydropterin synthase